MTQLLLPITSCFSIDEEECETGIHNCHYDANCTNTKGSFYCACLDGYAGNGISCLGKSLVQENTQTRQCIRIGFKFKKTYDLSETPDPFNCLKTWSRSYFLCLSLKNKRKKYRKDRLSLHEIILIQMQLLQTIPANPNFGLRYSLERRKYTRLDLMLCMRVSAAAKYSRKEIILK